MSVRSKQVVVAVLALSAAFVGGYAEFLPHRFFLSFPGFGHHWIAGFGPYNEHLTRDVGSLYLALLAASVWALLRPRAETFALVGTTWLVFSVPHLLFHTAHLDMFSTSDKVGNLVALGGTVLLAALLLAPAEQPRRRRPRDRQVGRV
jgi:hypothetical protein